VIQRADGSIRAHASLRVRWPTVAVLLSALLWPSVAQAHGISGGTSLPIPGWLFAWVATLVLVISFVALAVLWPTPRLARAPARPLLRLPRWLDALAGGAGVGVFVLVVYSGLAGEQFATSNITPTFVFVAFWVGVPLLSVVFGDVFRALNPWRATARAVAALARRLAPHAGRTEPVHYPRRLGCWPAVAGLLAFAWLELVYVNGTSPGSCSPMNGRSASSRARARRCGRSTGHCS
jgi:hypothetical protein